MSSSAPPPADTQLLLEHARWMRRLARSLVRDPARAEDLSQEAWTRILARPPRLDRPFRGWIATVMRNLVRAERRGDARRTARERLSARDEAEPSGDELVERAALQRELVQAVLELEEPYRATILLRYFEERTPSAIAERERIPVATVKTRLARGIALLRARLARTRTSDGRASVLFALARIAGAPPIHPPPLVWTALPFAMNAKLLFTLVALVAAGLAFFYYGREAEPAEANAARTPLAAADEQHPVAPADLPAQPQPESTRERAVVESEPRAAAKPAPAAAVAAARVRGRVIDVHDAPVAAVSIVLLDQDRPDDPRPAAEHAATVVARSGPDGSFELAGHQRGRLCVREPAWTTLLTGVPVDDRSGEQCRIVVAPRLELSGVVVDEDGAPLAGAHVSLAPPAALRAHLAQVLDFSMDESWEAASDELGRFRFDAAPAVEGALLRAEHDGFETHEEPAPLVARADLVLTLARPAGDGQRLAGLVLDPAGAPIEGALVSHGMDTTRTDERGRFAFRLDDPESLNKMASQFMKVPDDLLRAVQPGYLPVELRVRARDAAGRIAWPSPLVLRLESRTLSIEGRVQDEHGAPRAGLRVWIADPTLFGALVEPGAGHEPQFVQVEALLGGRGPGWSWSESDEDGRFVLDGLGERDYAVAAMDPATLQRVVASDVAAGRRDVVLVLASGALYPRLSGRVVDSHGDPVAGASVFPMCDALETRFEGEVISTQHQSVRGTHTDADGRFELQRVPRDLVYLRIEGSDMIPLEWGRHLAGGLAKLVGEHHDELTIAVELRCHFQVELEVPAEADQLGILDADGHEMIISEFRGNNREERERHPIVDGRSAMLAVGDGATTLVLYRAGGEVRRTPVRLTPGTPSNLRL